MTHRPSAQDLQLVLRAHLPKLYGDHKTVDINHGGGVLVVGSKGAPALPPPAPVPTLPEIIVENVAEVAEQMAADPVEVPAEVVEAPDVVETIAAPAETVAAVAEPVTPIPGPAHASSISR